MNEAELDSLRVEFEARRDLVLAHALVHYIHQGNSLELRIRNHNALNWLSTEQVLIAIRVEDSNELYRIRDRLLKKFDGEAGRRALSGIVARRRESNPDR